MTTLSQYGITWTWEEERDTGTFANGDPWVVGPITLTSITPETALIGGIRGNGSMINPMPGNYIAQGMDATIYTDSANGGTAYSDALNIALVGGTPLSVSNTRSVPAGSSICSVISTTNRNRNTYTGGILTAFTDFAVLTVLASAPAAGSFRPPYTGTDKTISWNKSDLDYSILRNLPPVAGMFAPTPGPFTRSWVEVEMEYNQNRAWCPVNHQQPGYDRDNGLAVSRIILELHQNYSNEQKEAAYVSIVQYGIDIYGQVKNGTWTIGGTVYPGIHDGSHVKAALVLAALALDDADMKTYVNGPCFQPSPYAWSPLGIPRYYADAQLWYVGDVNNSDDVGRTLAAGKQQYVAEDVGKPEWGGQHWSKRENDNANWGAVYRDVRYMGQVGMALAMHLTAGARALWNNPVYFDYYDRAFAIYTSNVPDTHTEGYIRAFWDANRSLAAFQPVLTVANAGSNRSTYSLDSPREVSLAAGGADAIYYTLDGGAATLYTAAFEVSVDTTITFWGVAASVPDSAIGTVTISFVTAGHPSAPVNLEVISGAGVVVPPSLGASLRFQFTDVSTTETGFRIETKVKDSGSAWRVDWTRNTALAGTGSTIDETLTLYDFNEEYEWRIVAFNALGDGSTYGASYIWTKPEIAPSGLTATPVSSSQINLTWVNGNAIGGERIYAAPSGSPLVLLGRVNTGVGNFNMTGLLPSYSYDIAIVGYNDNSLYGSLDAETARDAVGAFATVSTGAALESATVNALGTTLTLGFSGAVSLTGGSGGLVVTLGEVAVTAAYASGSGSAAIVYSLSRPIYDPETGSLTYTNPGNGLEDSQGLDIANITAFGITNNSNLVNYVVQDDFDGTAQPLRSAGAINGGTVDFAYATAPAPLVGATSGATFGGWFTNILYTLPADVNEIYGFVVMRPAEGNNYPILNLRNNSNVAQAEIQYRSDSLQTFHGGVQGGIGGTFGATVGVLWFRYKATVGAADGIFEFAFNNNSTSQTKPAPLGTITTGVGGPIRKIEFASGGTEAVYVWDKVRLSYFPINDNPF